MKRWRRWGVATAILCVLALLLWLRERSHTRTPRSAKPQAPAHRTIQPPRPLAELDPVPRPAPKPAPLDPNSPFFGEQTVRGTVLSHDGKPVPDAAVRCVPLGYLAHLPSERDHLSARTDEQGEFVFRRLPTVGEYQLAALSKARSQFGRLTVSDPAAPIVVRCDAIVYERLEFRYDRARFPAGPVAQSWGILRGMSLTSQMDAGDLFALGRREGIEFRSLPFAYARRTSDHPIAMSIRFVGYDAVSLNIGARPLSDWPKSRVIELKPAPTEPGTTTYVVRFSNVPSAHRDWLLVSVAPVGQVGQYLVDYRRTFVGRRDAAWEVRFLANPDRRFACVSIDHGTYTELVPQLPTLGTAEISVPQVEGSVNWMMYSNGVLRPRPYYPGVYRVGPLPIGVHQIFRHVRNAKGLLILNESRHIEIREEHRKIAWD